MQQAACTYRIAFGPRAGQKVLTLQTVPSQERRPPHNAASTSRALSAHAEVRCAINQRYKLEHLCRYITRPAISNERLTLNRAGDVVLQLKSPYHDGTTHIVMAPLEFMQRLAALVPRPSCISFASMACSRPMPSCDPRSFQARRSTRRTPQRVTATQPIPRGLRASA
ncbi:MAG: transposase [Gammaproteobacteria bacterium]